MILPPTPLLAAAVFATVLLGLRAPPMSAASPARAKAPQLALAAVLAALLAALFSGIAFALLTLLPPPPDREVLAASPLARGGLAAALLALQGLIALAVIGLLRLLWRRRLMAPGLPVPAAANSAALIGAVTGLAALATPDLPSALLGASGSALLLATLAMAMPALRERLDAGPFPSRLQPVLLAAAAAAAIVIALRLLDPR